MTAGRHGGRLGDLKLVGGTGRGRSSPALGHSPAVENKLAFKFVPGGSSGEICGNGVSVRGLVDSPGG